jgi:hypothetical protein
MKAYGSGCTDPHFLDTSVIQLVANRYTDYAIPAPWDIIVP